MSGGSYNYLFMQLSDDVYDFSALAEMESMASRLIELGYVDAGKETLHLKYTIEQSMARTEVMLERLADVWKAVEYYDSSDSGIERVEEEIKKYRKESPHE